MRHVEHWQVARSGARWNTLFLGSRPIIPAAYVARAKFMMVVVVQIDQYEYWKKFNCLVMPAPGYHLREHAADLVCFDGDDVLRFHAGVDNVTLAFRTALRIVDSAYDLEDRNELNCVAV